MSSPSIDIGELVAMMRERADAATADGLSATVDRSPNDGRPKHAAWVRFSSAAGESEVTIWGSGEAEVAIALGDEVTQTHLDLLTLSEAEDIVVEALRAVNGA